MEWLVWVVLAAHLVCVNHAAGGPLALILIHGRRPLEAGEHAIGQQLIRSIHLAFGLAFILGLGLIGLVWWRDTHVWQSIWSLFGVKLAWGAGQLVTFTVAWGWAGRVWRRQAVGAAPRWLFIFLAIFAATNLLYHFPPLFSLINGYRSGKIALTGPLQPADFRHHAFAAPLASLWMHVTLATVAFSALLQSWLIARRTRSSAAEQSETVGAQGPARWIQRGAIVTLITTALQLPLGFWVLLSQPSGAQRLLLGGDWLATSLFGASILLMFYLLNQLGEACWSIPQLTQIQRWLVIMVLIVLGMTITLERMNRQPGALSPPQLSQLTGVDAESTCRIALPRRILWNV